MAKQLVGLAAHQVADPLRTGFHRVVVVNAGDRLARGSRRSIDATPDAAADRVVEYQHPIGAGHLRDEALGFGIIDAAQFVLVVEVLDRAAMLDNG